MSTLKGIQIRRTINTPIRTSLGPINSFSLIKSKCNILARIFNAGKIDMGFFFGLLPPCRKKGSITSAWTGLYSSLTPRSTGQRSGVETNQRKHLISRVVILAHRWVALNGFDFHWFGFFLSCPFFHSVVFRSHLITRRPHTPHLAPTTASSSPLPATHKERKTF